MNVFLHSFLHIYRFFSLYHFHGYFSTTFPEPVSCVQRKEEEIFVQVVQRAVALRRASYGCRRTQRDNYARCNYSRRIRSFLFSLPLPFSLFFLATLPSSQPPSPLPSTSRVIAPRRDARAWPAKNLNCPSDYRLKLPPPVSFRLSFIHLAVIPKFICTTYVQPRGLPEMRERQKRRRPENYILSKN